MVDDACKRGIEFTPLLDGFGKFLRNMLYARLDAFTPDVINISEELYTKYKSVVPELKNGDIRRISKMLIDLQGTLRYSTTPRLLVETTFARMAWLDRLTDLRRALAAINDPSKASSNASDEALKKKVTDVQNMLDAVEEAKALQQQNENPFAALQNGIANGYNGDIYSRYEISAAWGSIKTHIADSGDIAFSVALNDTVLETGDIKETPFPIALTYLGDSASEVWGIKQMEEHPEYLERLKQILEEKLQTPIMLTVKSRAFNENELAIRKQARMSPYQLDLEKDAGLAKLKELFMAELIYSAKSSRPVVAPQQTDSCDVDSDDQ
jgi:DNA polymerase-3 subunit gamma/tau